MTLTDEQIERMLRARIPGGSNAADWFLPHDNNERAKKNIYSVVRLMFAAVSSEHNKEIEKNEIKKCLKAPLGNPVHQFRKHNCSDWYDGVPDDDDGGGPYETRTLYTSATSIPEGQMLIERAFLEKVSGSLGSFVSDEGWSQSDMDLMDGLDARIFRATPREEKR